MSRDFLDVNGITVHYAAEGAGDPVLLLHGGSGNGHSWQILVPDLARDYRLIVPDLRGHGQSSHTPGAYQLDTFAADIIGLVDALALAPVHLAGHSFGAQVAAIVAARAPGALRSLALLDTPLKLSSLRAHIEANRPTTTRWRDLAALRLPAADLIPLLYAMPMLPPLQPGEGGQGGEVTAAGLLGPAHPWFPYMAECLAHHDPAFLDAILDDFDRAHAAFDVAALFPYIPAPTLLVQGDPAAGGLMSDEEAQWGLSLLPRGRHTRLEGVSHTMQNENPAAVLDALRSFWK